MAPIDPAVSASLTDRPREAQRQKSRQDHGRVRPYSQATSPANPALLPHAHQCTSAQFSPARHYDVVNPESMNREFFRLQWINGNARIRQNATARYVRGVDYRCSALPVFAFRYAPVGDTPKPAPWRLVMTGRRLPVVTARLDTRHQACHASSGRRRPGPGTSRSREKWTGRFGVLPLTSRWGAFW